MIIAIGGGLGLLIGGGRPREPLHFVYAIVALGVLPIAGAISREASARLRGLAILAGALIAIAVIARLFQTG